MQSKNRDSHESLVAHSDFCPEPFSAKRENEGGLDISPGGTCRSGSSVQIIKRRLESTANAPPQ